MIQRGNAARRKSRAAGSRPAPIRNAVQPKVSVVVPAENEKRTIARVIEEARSVHPDTEVIVVANGSSDGTASIASRMGAYVIRYPEPLGHDVGRAIGAMAAGGDILLFTDADIVIPAARLIPFVHAIEQGFDIALNRYQGAVRKSYVHPTVLAKKALNLMLSAPELGASSLTAVPHAISRKALEEIGAALLAVPPKAQAVAASLGLRFTQAGYVNVGRMNARKSSIRHNRVKRLILGDHLEAMNWWIRQAGNPRADYPDLGRARERVNDV